MDATKMINLKRIDGMKGDKPFHLRSHPARPSSTPTSLSALLCMLDFSPFWKKPRSENGGN